MTRARRSAGIEKRFRDLSVDVREERLVRYIVHQVECGRHVDDIINDAYVVDHTSTRRRATGSSRIPMSSRASRSEIRRQFAGYGDSVARPKQHGGARVGRSGPTMANCPTCSFENSDDSNFCRRCGSRLITADPNETTITYAPADREELDATRCAREPARAPVLLIRAGGGSEGEAIALDVDVLTIGRSPHSDLFLDDVTVSRHHARVLRDEAGFLVEDLNSLNGTYVNRKRIERQRLFDGDELQIGKFKLAFLEQSETMSEP